MKKVLSFLTLMLLGMVGMNAQTSETLTPSTKAGYAELTVVSAGTSGSGSATEVQKGGIVVTSDLGYIKDHEMTVYKNGSMTIGFKEGLDAYITKVELTVKNYHFQKPEGWTAVYTNDTSEKFTDKDEKETFTTTDTDRKSFTISNASNGKTTVKVITVTYVVDGSYEAYVSYDMSRLQGWAFPKYVLLGEEISVPYQVQTYADNLQNVSISLMVNGTVAEKKEIATIAMDEEMGEGTYTGLFTYKPEAAGNVELQLVLDFWGAYLDESGEHETETVSILVSETAPEPEAIADIASLRAYATQGIEDVMLTLTDAKVTYVGSKTAFNSDTFAEETVDVVVLEDATSGIMLQGSGLGTLVKAGQTLNGKLAMSIESVWGEISAKLTNGIEGVEAVDGEVTPLLLTEDNLADYAESYDWRLVTIPAVTVKWVASEYNEGEHETHIVSDLLGDEEGYGVQDVLGATFTDPADGAKVDATGYIYSMLGGLIVAFQPISFTEVTTGIDAISSTAANGQTPVYTLSGTRVSAPQKGLYIVGGKKMIVK